MTETIAAANQKGGAGKTTAAVSLCGALVEAGHRTLLCDFDPSGAAGRWLGAERTGIEALDAITGDAPITDFVVNTAYTHLEVMPASLYLPQLQDRLAERGIEGVDAYMALRRVTEALEASGRWDFIVLDSPPRFDFVSIASLLAARWIVIPVEVSAMALEDLADTFSTLATLQDHPDYAWSGEIVGLIAQRHNRTVLAKEFLDFLSAYDQTVLSVVPETVRMREAPTRGPITVYEPDGLAAEAYRQAMRLMLQRMSERKEMAA